MTTRFKTACSKCLITSLILSLSAMPIAAQAQSYDYAQSEFRQDREARLSLKIPFGTQRQDETAKPKLSFSVRHYDPRPEGSEVWGVNRQQTTPSLGFYERDLSLSLSATPTLSLNGTPLILPNSERAEVSDEVKTAGKFALGAGLVTLAAAVVVVGVYAITFEQDDS